MSDHGGGDALQAAWDAVQRGETPAADSDFWLVETLQAVHARDAVPPLDPTFVHDLREELMTSATVPVASTVGDLRAPNGHLVSIPWSMASPVVTAAPTRRRLTLTLPHLATAALVLLTVIGGFLAFGPGRPGRVMHAPALVPAISATPPVSQTVTSETLLDVTTAALSDQPGILVFKRLTLQPSSKPLTVLPLTGPVFIVLESGKLTATEAGTEDQLAVGDTFSPADPDHDIDLRATGSEEAVVLLVYFHVGQDLRFPRDPVIHALEVLLSTVTDARLGCPCRLVLERFSVPVGEGLPPQEANPAGRFVIGEGVLGLTLEGERLPYRFKAGEERIFHLGQYLPIDLVKPRTEMTLRNAGDGPLVFYRLTLTPRGAGGSTVAAATVGTPAASD